mgnify:CR=1 FL=1
MEKALESLINHEEAKLMLIQIKPKKNLEREMESWADACEMRTKTIPPQPRVISVKVSLIKNPIITL